MNNEVSAIGNGGDPIDPIQNAARVMVVGVKLGELGAGITDIKHNQEIALETLLKVSFQLSAAEEKEAVKMEKLREQVSELKTELERIEALALKQSQMVSEGEKRQQEKLDLIAKTASEALELLKSLVMAKTGR